MMKPAAWLFACLTKKMTPHPGFARGPSWTRIGTLPKAGPSSPSGPGTAAAIPP